MLAICERVAQGELAVNVCRELGIDRSTAFRWAQDDPHFGTMYAQAREMQAHALAEDALLMADGVDGEAERIEAMLEKVQDAKDSDKEALLRALTAAAVQRDRLRVDTRKWLTSKIAPKLYGEKVDVTSNGKTVSACLVLPPES